MYISYVFNPFYDIIYDLCQVNACRKEAPSRQRKHWHQSHRSIAWNQQRYVKGEPEISAA